MLSYVIGKEVKGYCDWCAKPVDHPLTPVTLVTPRGSFQDQVCDECAATIMGDESAAPAQGG